MRMASGREDQALTRPVLFGDFYASFSRESTQEQKGITHLVTISGLLVVLMENLVLAAAVAAAAQAGELRVLS